MATIANSKVKISSDISRVLSSKTFEPGSTISLDVPRDSVFKHLAVTIDGAIQTTYASGSPVADATSTMNRLINNIQVVENGSFTIKNITPWFLQIQSLLATSNFSVRRSRAGAAAIDPLNVTVDGGFVFGTTTQYTTLIETVLVSFENVLASQGREETWWDTRGLASAEIKFNTSEYSNLLEYSNAAPVVWSNSTLTIRTSTIETQNVPLEASFSYWKQTVKEALFSGVADDQLIDINRGNFLQGLMLLVRNGGTTRPLSNSLLTSLKLIINGTNFIQNTTFSELQRKNTARYGINAPFVSNASLFQGAAYMDLLTPLSGNKYGALGTAQDVRAPAVDMVQLSVSTNANGTYSSPPASLQICTNEIVQPSK